MSFSLILSYLTPNHLKGHSAATMSVQLPYFQILFKSILNVCNYIVILSVYSAFESSIAVFSSKSVYYPAFELLANKDCCFLQLAVLFEKLCFTSRHHCE